MQCNGFDIEDYGLYALGESTGSEKDGIREHLGNGCITCEDELRKSRDLWYSVAFAVPDVKPARSLRSRVIQSVGGQPAWWRQPIAAIGVFATVVLAIASGWVLGEHRYLPERAFSPVYQLSLPALPLSNSTPTPTPAIIPPPARVNQQVGDLRQTLAMNELSQDLTRERQRGAQLEAELVEQKSAAQEAEKRLLAVNKTPATPSDDARKQLTTLTSRTQELDRQVNTYRSLLEIQRKRLDQNPQLAGIVSDPELRVVKLRATEKQNAVEGHALISGGSQLVFYASALPALPANRVYQLWLLRSNGQPVSSAGTFTPDSSKRGFVQLKDSTLLSGVTGIAVTDEPMGGSTLPTGHKWMIGS